MPPADQTEARLLADILANPDDDGPRLVLADWLTQRGDPRGELMVTQCQLERATGGERARLFNRAYDLLERQGVWLNELKDVVRGVETRRGFVYAINATAPVFARTCGPWFEREPIEELRVIKPSTRDLATLRKTTHLARLRSLVFLDPVRIADAGHIALLAGLFEVLAVRSFDLRLAVGDEVATAARGALARLASPVLETLKLRVRSTQAGVIAEGLTSATLPALRQIAVPKQAVRAVTAGFPRATVSAVDAG